MIRSMILHLILSLATIHSGYYSLPSATYLHHGYATEVVTIAPAAIDCHGRVRAADLSAATNAGGEETEPATYSAHRHAYLARLLFRAGDQGRWYVTSLTYSCADGSWGQYLGVHPSFLVR